jgi:pimeloyl-ACP methyl ester carboxylesterase
LTNNEIGRRLHLAPDTVRWYNKQIFGKLGAHNRTQAVQLATAAGLFGSVGPVISRESEPQPTEKIKRSPIGFVRNGDVHIAYQTIGEGPVDLLFIHGFLSHLELAWEEPGFSSFFEQLSRFARVILFDKRGVGLSDRIRGAPTLEQTIDDAISVLDAVESNRAFVMGTSEGGAASVLLASVYPQRSAGLILYATTPKVVQKDGTPAWAISPANFQIFIEDLQENWGGAWALDRFAPSRAREEAFRTWWGRILRSASSPSSIRAVLEVLAEVDIRDLLPSIRVPTLVVHKTDDRMVAVEAGRFLADRIPGSAMLELPGQDHIYFVDSAALIGAVERFLQDRPAEGTLETRIAIVMSVTTNADGPPVGLIRTEINSFLPRYVSLNPTQVIAVFESPSQAIRCARKLQRRRSFGALQIGLHVGECSLEDGAPGKIALSSLQIAVDAAAAGEIIITRTLKDILAGADFEFSAWREPDLDLFTLAQHT